MGVGVAHCGREAPLVNGHFIFIRKETHSHFITDVRKLFAELSMKHYLEQCLLCFSLHHLCLLSCSPPREYECSLTFKDDGSL